MSWIAVQAAIIETANYKLVCYTAVLVSSRKLAIFCQRKEQTNKQLTKS